MVCKTYYMHSFAGTDGAIGYQHNTIYELTLCHIHVFHEPYMPDTHQYLISGIGTWFDSFTPTLTASTCLLSALVPHGYTGARQWEPGTSGAETRMRE